MKPEAIIFFGVFDFALPEYQKWVRGLSKYAGYTKIYISDLASLSDGIKNYFDQVIKVDDALDYDTLARVMRQLQTDFSLRQVFFYREDGVYLCGKLRSEFGIRGLQESQAESARNKFIMKEIVRSHRITTSLAEYALTAGDAAAFADKNGYPIVAKPVDGFATINTAVLRNEADIQQYFDNYSIKYQFLAKVSTGKVLIETYSQGIEYVVDSVIREDEVVFSNVSKYSFDKCVEAVSKGVGIGIYPLPINDELTRALVAENKRVIAALGLTNTVTHAEFFVEPRTGKITFGEIAARVGGCSFYPQVIKHCYGVDFAELAFDTLMENVTDAAVTPHEFVPAAGFLLPAKAGKVRHIPTLNEMLEAAGIIEYHINIHEGDTLTPVNNTTGDTGMMILTADTLTDLLDRLAAAQKLFMEKLIVE